MAKNKIKKLLKFWKNYDDTIIGKGAKEQQKRLQRIYNKHRAKSKNKS